MYGTLEKEYIDLSFVIYGSFIENVFFILLLFISYVNMYNKISKLDISFFINLFLYKINFSTINSLFIRVPYNIVPRDRTIL